MRHDWPVRTPRPVTRRLPALAPLVTGQRIIDCLFPVAQGGKAAVPGGFGTGKTVLLEALAKGCNADVIIYLGCGERGNEMAGVLEEFPQLVDPRTNRPLMERTVIIANTSNMPVAAREASIYSAITVAEYFRDQGLAVALMADSTSRWAEALREVSGRFGELPGEGGYPAYLSSRLADFYERAAIVEPLAGGVGSVTVIGAISPPSGDFSEPVTSHTKRYVKAFWALDVKRAQSRFYPAIHPLQSYAEDAHTFAPWWTEQGNSQWLSLRRRFLTLLDTQAHLERMARIIGKDSLPARQQLDLALRGDRQRGVPPPKRFFRDRPRVQPRAAERDDARPRTVHRSRGNGCGSGRPSRGARAHGVPASAAADGRGNRRRRVAALRRARGRHGARIRDAHARPGGERCGSRLKARPSASTGRSSS